MEEMLAVQKDSRLISSESETDIISISDDNSINSDNNNDAESIASDNDEAVNEVSLERRFLNMDTELNQQVEFQQETENEFRIEALSSKLVNAIPWKKWKMRHLDDGAFQTQ